MKLSPDAGRPDHREPGHFAYIDAVRGLAFLAVLALHAALQTGHFFGRHWLVQGGYGVQLFFLASAITLCHSMAARRQSEDRPAVNFYLRRLFRIGPLFWLAMVFYWTVPGVIPAEWLADGAPGGVHPSYFALTALFLHGWHPYTFNSIVPGGWSIAVEMTFYLVFPLLFYALGGSVKRTVVAVLASVIYVKALGRADVWLGHRCFPGVPGGLWNFFTTLWFPAQLPVFLVGFLAYHLLGDDSVKRFVRSRFWAGALLCLCAMLLLSFLEGGSGFVPNPFLVVLILAGLIVAVSGGKMPWLVNPVVCYLGKISYSCYLVHFAALGITLRLLGGHATGEGTFLDSGNSAGNLALFAKLISMTLVLTVAVSTVTLHLIENPGIALGRQLIRRISARSKAG